MNNQDTCKYDPTKPADRHCFECGEGLCNSGSCGFNFEDHDFCNECWVKFVEEDAQDFREWEDRVGRCWSCGEELEAVMENNGFTEPEGPSHWEISGYKPCQCRRDDKNE